MIKMLTTIQFEQKINPKCPEHPQNPKVTLFYYLTKCNCEIIVPKIGCAPRNSISEQKW